MRGFINVRKAYLVMDAVVERERVFAERHKGSASRKSIEQFGSARQSVESAGPMERGGVSATGGSSNSKSATSRSGNMQHEEDSDDDDQFVDALDHTNDDLGNDDSDILPRHLINNDMDAYIHSSTHLFFGLLQLMLSLIPPTMSRLLSTIGFSGSRSLGLQMLWRAADFPNLNGAMVGEYLHYNKETTELTVNFHNRQA